MWYVVRYELVTPWGDVDSEALLRPSVRLLYCDSGPAGWGGVSCW